CQKWWGGRCIWMKFEIGGVGGNTGKTLCSAALALLVFACASQRAVADQGGVSFWLPGAFGSLAAVPAQPGWSLGLIYLHSSVTAGGDVSASRAIRVQNQTTNLSVNLNANLAAQADILVFAPGYTLPDMVMGGRLTLSMLVLGGGQHAAIDANVTGALGPIGFATQRTIGDSLTGFGDLFPQAKLQWNSGVHNYMIYGMANLPVG